MLFLGYSKKRKTIEKASLGKGRLFVFECF
jgi:hypothetical protein